MARRLPPGRASVTGLYSRAELLDAVRRWRRLYGCAPVRSDWDPVRARQRCDPDLAAAKAGRYRSGQWPSADTVRNHFGSFGAAIEAAGLHPRPGGADVRWTDEAILEALRDIAYEQGSPPRPENLDDPSEELPGVEVVVLRFGTWQEAIAAAGLVGE